MSTASPSDDQILFERAGWVRALARSLLDDPDAADDAAQEAWLAALRWPPAHRNLRAWFATLIKNFARRARRGERRRRLREEMAAASEVEQSTSELVARAELHRRVVEAVLALPEPYRATILLRFFEDLSPSAIARRLGIPAATVRSRLMRALEQLRERLDREHGGDRRAWMFGLARLASSGAAPALVLGGIVMGVKLKVALVTALVIAL